ncbi:MAG: S9 family peptidase [Planctomycetota bacterium]
MKQSHLFTIALGVFMTGVFNWSTVNAFEGGSPISASTTTQNDLIPREVLFGNPEKATARISPDGKMLAWRAPQNGVMNVWIAPLENLEDARCITDDKTTGISQFFWAYTNNHMMYLQDDNGDEDFHLYVVDLQTDEVKDLTPYESISAQVYGTSHLHPEEVLVGVNDRGQHWFHDVHRVNIISGEREIVVENDQFVGFVADNDYNIKAAVTFTPQAELMIFKKDDASDSGWSELMTIGAEDVMTTSPAGIDKTGDIMYMIDSRGRDTAAMKTFNLETGEMDTVFATDKADIAGAMIHPTENTIQAVSYNYDRVTWEVMDEAVAADLEILKGVEDGEVDVTSRTLDDTKWTVAYTLDDGPVKFYLYDRPTQEATFLFSHRPELENIELAKMHPVIIKSRDGLDLVSYLTLPVESDPEASGRPANAMPMVLLVHGGPWARDEWGYNTLHQLLANRGYAVLSVNYRGSTGFGKNFINAANMEWAGKMHDDLIDAVNWAVEEGVAIEDKVAIMGGSYGGYATLVGLTFTPDQFACGVDIVGPSSLISLMENPPPYWMPIMPMMQTRVGDYTSEEGREFLQTRSPLFKVDEITRPLLIGQGANDPRVKQEESDQIVAAMQEKKIPVTYMLYPEEGHGFDRPENNISFFAVSEVFLATHLGGRYQPLEGAFEGANVEVPAGSEDVPGLIEAMDR